MEEKVELTKTEIDNINTRISRIQQIQIDLMIHQKGLNDYGMEILKKYNKDDSWKLHGNFLVKVEK